MGRGSPDLYCAFKYQKQESWIDCAWKKMQLKITFKIMKLLITHWLIYVHDMLNLCCGITCFFRNHIQEAQEAYRVKIMPQTIEIGLVSPKKHDVNSQQYHKVFMKSSRGHKQPHQLWAWARLHLEGSHGLGTHSTILDAKTPKVMASKLLLLLLLLLWWVTSYSMKQNADKN